MRFENGMLGLCISIVAIMGMVLSGFVLSVDAREVQTTTYDYVTDISGLFEYSQDPTFIDYNPSANWTGYYTDTAGVTAGINYSTVDRANSYPIGQADGEAGSGTVDLEDLNLTQMNPPVTGNSPPAYWQYGVKFNEPPQTTGLQGFDIPSPGVATLQTLMDAMDLGEADSVTFTLGNADDSIIIIPNSSWNYREYDLPMSPLYHFYTASYYRDTSAATSVSVDLESGVATGYTASGTIAWRGSTTTMCIVYGGTAAEASYVQWNLQTSLTYTAYTTPTPIYMDISQGVSVDSSANWSNGYVNGQIDILFRVQNAGTPYTNTFVFSLGNIIGSPLTTSLTLQISVASSGNVTITMSTGAATSPVLSMGDWRNFIISLDTVAGVYRAIPVTSFVSFTTYETLEASAQTIELDTPGRQTMTGFTVSTTGNSLTFGVVQTGTFLNTYDSVMIDPQIDISDHFTDLTNVRLNFFSFALYGDSININAQTFELDGARINVPTTTAGGEEVDRWLTLTNIYITFEGANTYLTFVNDGITVDLGETTTTLISFYGMWYFTTGLYSGVPTTETVYEWDYEDFAYNGNTAIIAFLGILAGGTIVGTRFVKSGMSALDYIVVGFAAICALALVVV